MAGGSREPKTSPRRVAATLRQAQAVELRLANRTYGEIAKALGFSCAADAYNAVHVALMKTLDAPSEELRATTHERYNVILRTWWPLMLGKKDVPPDRDATVLCLKALDGIRGLMGLDAPAQAPVDRQGKAVPAQTMQMVNVVYDHAQMREIGRILQSAGVLELDGTVAPSALGDGSENHQGLPA